MTEERQAGASAGRRARLRAATAIVVFVLAIAVLLHTDPADLYLWAKALHIIAVISWMAGLLYLPRLFIYHCDAEPGSRQSETFKVMERRLMTVIMWPALVISWAIGLYLAASVYGFQGGWLHLKLLAVLALSVTHLYFASAVASFSRDERRHAPRHWRLMNEVPTLLMIVIVIMAVVKPF
ncbi:protoporphyrinogen oxidase HemJ [Ensifer soli]|uniref:protoporphyrinogen oxidase HemJ n=1 Tax=Ciceribacter sp. sgz301302 TaxID=3342379 RepID=UPI0035BA76A3